MDKTLTRACAPRAQARTADFVDTEFMHDESDADYSGFAPTQLFAVDRRTSAPVAASISGMRCMSATAAPVAVPFAMPVAAQARLASPLDEDWMPSAWATARWVEEQEAKALQAGQRARAAMAAHGVLEAASASARVNGRRNWRVRIEAALDRLLPGNLGSLLQLFICVSLSMALISALLPMVDKI